MFDLTSPEVSYMVGLFQSDGSHYGSTAGKGRLSLEISERDADILPKLQRLIPYHSNIKTRTRDTNFKKAYTSQCLNICSQEVRTEFERFGVPVGKKSDSIQPPTEAFSRPDYLRGIIDGDGSVGFTARGYPFVGIVTASPFIAQHFCAEVADVCGVRRTARPNSRDGVFNIMVMSCAAALLAGWCYPPGSLAIQRKYNAALEIAQWKPPSSRYGHARQAWTADEDAVVSSNSVEKAAELLGRTVQSVSMRRWRLRDPGIGRNHPAHTAKWRTRGEWQPRDART
ncbi:hypothetical protein [Nocardia sp. NPDC006630]|uniref:hypothetical protein n=1 Tax=Nocardia sp. NPDC006630 TaxID=3157181 RepID=UPI0033A628C4